MSRISNFDAFSSSTEMVFNKLISELKMHLDKHGIKKKAFSDEPVFEHLDDATKVDIVGSLSVYINIIEASYENTDENRHDLRFIWAAMKELSIVPSEDFLDYYKKGSIIEIYDSAGRQMFRNFEFFDICGYSLEEIFCKSWFELYKRDEEITRKIFEFGSRYASKDLTGITLSPCPPHLLTEIASEAGHVVEMDIKALVPLRLKGSDSVCVAAIEECKYVNKNAGLKERKLEENNNQIEAVRPFLELV